MDEHDHVDGDGFEPTSIGVGMGGSCPNCRAPVDLGQEFCLECGAPIRFSPRTRRPQRRPGAPAASAATPPGKSGFPWIPFLVVLALIGGGLVLALVGGDDGKKSKSARTDSPLPSIKNSVPEETSTTQTQTLQDCDPLQPLNELEPAEGDAADSASDPLGAPVDDAAQPGVADGSSEQIPQLGDETADAALDGFEDPATDLPSTEPGSGDAAAVTVDQDGNICGGDSGSTTPTDPSATTSTTPTADTGATTGTTTGSTASGDWPAGRAGWTVVVAGFPSSGANAQTSAQDRAADLQEDGYTDGGVLLSDEFKSLCPGFYVTFSGVFTTERLADARLAELKSKDPGTYVNIYAREIKADGTPRGNCTSAN